MLNAAHVLEVALLLLAAFLVGAVSGAATRALALSLHRSPAARARMQVATRVRRTAPDEPGPTEQAPAPPAVAAFSEDVMPPEVAAEAPPADAPGAAATEEAPGVEHPEQPAEQDADSARPTPVPVAEPATSAATEEPPPTPEPDTEVGAALSGPPPTDQPTRPHTPDDDEFAAMRAIEGNWTPRRRPPRLQPAPVAAEDDGSVAVAASAAAVEAAARAAQALVSETAAKPTPEPASQPGRPPGLSAPRQGRKDSLNHVIGILPIIETSLNSLGIYHFDQVADFSDENVAWLERHLGIEGRVKREQWREQARELALALRATAATDG